MTDGEKEGSDRATTSSAKAGGPLSDTFPEFVKYARNRQKKGTRTSAHVPPPPSRVTAPAVLTAAGAVIVVFALVLIATLNRPEPLPGPSPKSVKGSAEVSLPKPTHPGQVPDSWLGLALGEPLEKVDPARRRPYSGQDNWADWTYTPDPGRPEAFLGLSVHKNRLYKISMRLGESSTVNTGPYMAACTMAYGSPLGYEYLTPGHSHAVTIFQTESRALRLDSVKGEEITLAEVVLIDMEMATAREIARSRGQK